MRKSLLLIVISIITQVTFALSENQVDKQLQTLIDEFRTTNHITSATLTISKPNENTPTTYVSGTVSKDTLEPVNRDNLFQIGSITKSFIATIILKLQSQGLLSLDDPLSSYLPEYTQ